MIKNALKYGIISGIIISTFMAVSMQLNIKSMDFNKGEIVGYFAMFIAFLLLFIGVKNYRDNQCKGYINFINAFKLGAYIALITATLYVITWMVEYHFFIPDFMDKYSECVINKAKEKKASATEMASKIKEIETYKEMYKNPVTLALLTYMEILPLGLVVALISALILKKKEKRLQLSVP